MLAGFTLTNVPCTLADRRKASADLNRNRAQFV
jgi:hypothetical protein